MLVVELRSLHSALQHARIESNLIVPPSIDDMNLLTCSPNTGGKPVGILLSTFLAPTDPVRCISPPIGLVYDFTNPPASSSISPRHLERKPASSEIRSQTDQLSHETRPASPSPRLEATRRRNDVRRSMAVPPRGTDKRRQPLPPSLFHNHVQRLGMVCSPARLLSITQS